MLLRGFGRGTWIPGFRPVAIRHENENFAGPPSLTTNHLDPHIFPDIRFDPIIYLSQLQFKHVQPAKYRKLLKVNVEPENRLERDCFWPSSFWSFHVELWGPQWSLDIKLRDGREYIFCSLPPVLAIGSRIPNFWIYLACENSCNLPSFWWISEALT